MRAFGFLGTVITMAIGMYIYSLQVKTLTPSAGGGDRGRSRHITGVKNDLIGIANAERGYLASQGKYASLDELISGTTSAIKGERPPYIYDVEINSGELSGNGHSHHERRSGAAVDYGDMQMQASD